MPGAKGELGLFVAAEKERKLSELERLDQQQRARVRRRLWSRWLGWGAIGVLLGQWSPGFVGFFTPQAVGCLRRHRHRRPGRRLEGRRRQGVVREGKFYITRVPEGFLAVSWKCPHLGCTVPRGAQRPGPPDGSDQAFTDEGRFKGPCHGSIYNRYGQIIEGPAPRPMDRFPLKIDAGGKLIVETGPAKAITRRVATSTRSCPRSRPLRITHTEKTRAK